MKALITGASSGIGREFAIELSNLGYDLILVSRNKEELDKLQKSLPTKTNAIVMDLSSEANCKNLYIMTKNENIDMLINNAGFGLYGDFSQTDYNTEINMIDLNVKAVHVLTKLYLKDMIKKDEGYILNVASSAAFAPGPLMATYYATKAYVYRLTEALYYELKKKKSKVHISCLCPGPVDTNFNKVAGVKFSVKPLSANDVVKYSLKCMLKNKMLIIPGFKMKCAKFFSRFFSDKFLMSVTYKVQKKKENAE